MRHSKLWPVAGAAISVSVVFILGGVASGGELGQMVAGYGALLMLAGLYLTAGLAIHERVWRRVGAPASASRPLPIDLQGRRVF
jgi:uncharacterized membrane protein